MEKKLWTEPDQAAAMLGEAVASAPFQLLLDMLEQYEGRILTEGIDDETLSKDYLRGFVHAVRTLRSDMNAARQAAMQMDARAEWEEKKKREKEKRVMQHPGTGPGGLSY